MMGESSARFHPKQGRKSHGLRQHEYRSKSNRLQYNEIHPSSSDLVSASSSSHNDSRYAYASWNNTSGHPTNPGTPQQAGAKTLNASTIHVENRPFKYTKQTLDNKKNNINFDPGEKGRWNQAQDGQNWTNPLAINRSLPNNEPIEARRESVPLEAQRGQERMVHQHGKRIDYTLQEQPDRTTYQLSENVKKEKMDLFVTASRQSIVSKKDYVFPNVKNRQEIQLSITLRPEAVGQQINSVAVANSNPALGTVAPWQTRPCPQGYTDSRKPQLTDKLGDHTDEAEDNEANGLVTIKSWQRSRQPLEGTGTLGGLKASPLVRPSGVGPSETNHRKIGNGHWYAKPLEQCENALADGFNESPSPTKGQHHQLPSWQQRKKYYRQGPAGANEYHRLSQETDEAIRGTQLARPYGHYEKQRIGKRAYHHRVYQQHEQPKLDRESWIAGEEGVERAGTEFAGAFVEGQVEVVQAPVLPLPSQAEEVCLLPPGEVTRSTSLSPSRVKVPSQIGTCWPEQGSLVKEEIGSPLYLRSRSSQRGSDRHYKQLNNSQKRYKKNATSRSLSRYRTTDLDSAMAEASCAEDRDRMQTKRERISDPEQNKASTSASLYNLTRHNYSMSTVVGAIPPESPCYSAHQCFSGARSYTSLLETNIDTGENFELPLVVNTNVGSFRDVEADNSRRHNLYSSTPLGHHLENAGRNDWQAGEEVATAIPPVHSAANTADERARSLFNLSSMQTSGQYSGTPSYGRSAMPEVAANSGSRLPHGFCGTVGQGGKSSSGQPWQKAKSMQGLLHGDAANYPFGTHISGSQEVMPFSGAGCHGGVDKGNASGYGLTKTSSLIAKLRERARSSYELRVAQSLSKLDLPEWLDKYDFEEAPSSLGGRITASRFCNALGTAAEQTQDNQSFEEDLRQVHAASLALSQASFANITLPSFRYASPAAAGSSRFLASYYKRHQQQTLQPLRSPTRLDPLDARTADTGAAVVETIAEPIWSGSGSSGRYRMAEEPFLRPSQLVRMRSSGVPRLQPIQSRLNSSMRSLASLTPSQKGRLSSDEGTRFDPNLVPVVSSGAPKTGLSLATSVGLATPIKLTPQDFVPRYSAWAQYADASTARGRAACVQNARRARTEPPKSDHKDLATEQEKSHFVLPSKTSGSVQPPKAPEAGNLPPQVSLVSSRRADSSRLDEGIVQDDKLEHLIEGLKPADQESVIDNSQETEADKRQSLKMIHCENEWSADQFWPQNKEKALVKAPAKHTVYPAQAGSNLSDTQETNKNGLVDAADEASSLDWRSIDFGGETETEATDGLNQISDLVCLTDLVDTCMTRHQALLANRPSALENLLINMGWWPVAPTPGHHYSPPRAAESISVAANDFDPGEDSHCDEFLDLLAGPAGRRPLNLGEFGLSHLTSNLERRPADGLLYLRCGQAECSLPMVRVAAAINWLACGNCYTVYCSAKCRDYDRDELGHPEVCSFARAKRICGRVLRNLASGQLASLIALAKAGLARLGRGGVVLTFSCVRHAEVFFTFCQQQTGQAPASLGRPVDAEAASRMWQRQRIPSPGALMSPPLYLTLNELDELDSGLAAPCRAYALDASFVLIVIVCAHELHTSPDGRPVHLFKQSLVLPFSASSTILHSPGVSEAAKLNAGSVRPHKPQRPPAAITFETKSELRESHFAQLQRQLREHGVSLRHHHPDVYTRVLEHVKTGCQLQPISFVFHDFKLKRSMLCRLQSISEVYITPYSGQEINRGSSNDVPQNLEQHRPAHFPEPSDSRQEKEIPSKEAWRRNKTNKASVTLRAQYQTFTQDQTSTTVQPNASEMARLSVNQSTLRMARTTETEL